MAVEIVVGMVIEVVEGVVERVVVMIMEGVYGSGAEGYFMVYEAAVGVMVGGHGAGGVGGT